MFEPDVRRVDYERYTNRQLATVPLVVLGLALLVIAGWYVTTGAPATLGQDFTGGTELRVQAPGGTEQIRGAFDREVASIRSVVGEENTYVITFPVTDTDIAESLEAQAEQGGMTVLSRSLTSGVIAAQNQVTALGAVGVGFVGMSVVVFLLFRTFVPSIAVVVSAFSDIVIPIAAMNIVGIELTMGTVAGLLLLIGYSVDSDILLNNHILRRSGGFYESAYRAMRTGVTMTLTSLSAVVVMAIVASIFGIEILSIIGTVLAVGLAADLMNTYLLNLSLLRWYRRVEV